MKRTLSIALLLVLALAAFVAAQAPARTDQWIHIDSQARFVGVTGFKTGDGTFWSALRVRADGHTYMLPFKKFERFDEVRMTLVPGELVQVNGRLDIFFVETTGGIQEFAVIRPRPGVEFVTPLK